MMSFLLATDMVGYISTGDVHFFDRYDLNGKTIIPFATHEGSGLADVVEDLRQLYPDANITGANSFYGHEVRRSTDKVDAWIKKMGY
jgi:hypothetical protein